MQPTDVKIVEVSPRDGLQNEKQLISTDLKIELSNRLIQAGFQNVEAASFVSPKWVPQMADGSAVIAGLHRKQPSGRRALISALVPNLKGLESALAAGVDEVVIFGAASEAFSQKNINCSVQESIDRFKPVAELAKANALRVRASISCCLGCPYQGDVSSSEVLKVVEQMLALGVDEIDIADTIGVGTANKVKALMLDVASVLDLNRVAGHFHDTYGQAVANVLASVEAGVRIFHSSVAGLGGCPYAKGATGNVATEDILYLLEGLGLNTGIDMDEVVAIGNWISLSLGRPNASRAGSALFVRQNRGECT
ncbi:MAG: hydroxymethylglutaryl-CoA lyase [Burkholderiales bacterium]|nr:hydroxymethylglutaryl-CoA lyase [Burkholderiales bacterium]